MYLELSAMYLMERYRELEADRASDRVCRIAFRDRASRRRDPGTDVGRGEHLDPAARSEQSTGRLVRPVQAQPKP